MKDPAFTEHYLLYLLAQSSSAASRGFHQHLARRGIEVSTWRILASLYPDREKSIGELAEDCMIVQSTLTRTVIRLEKRGLIRRRAAPADRRITHVSLTPTGEDLATDLVADALAHEQILLESYSAAEIDALKRALGALRQRANSIDCDVRLSDSERLDDTPEQPNEPD